MLRSVRASSSCAPLWRARTTAARSATHVVPQMDRRTRAVARNSTTPRSVWPTCGTTESSTSRCTRSGWASAYRSPTYEPYEMPSSVQRSTPSARRSDSMSATTSSVPKNCRRAPSCREHARTAVADRRPEIGAAHLGLQRGTVERPGAGASLVVDDDPVVVQLGAEDLRDARQRRHAGLARAAGDQEQHAARRTARCRRPRRRAATSLPVGPRGRAARRASSTCSRRTRGTAPNRSVTAVRRRTRPRRRRRHTGRQRSRERRGARAHRAGYLRLTVRPNVDSDQCRSEC